jgi:hypothetical protein
VAFPLDATGATVELYGILEGPTIDHWGDASATWGTAGVLWSAPTWNDIACDVLSVGLGWGVDEATGPIAAPAAGQWALELYDPDRSLDPLNPSSRWSSMLMPRSMLRLKSAGGNQLGVAYLDVLEHHQADHTGRLEAVDGIGLLAGSTTSDGFDPFRPGGVLPTIGALIPAVLADCGIADQIGLGATVPAAGSTYDPLIAYRSTAGQNAWQLIRDACLDVLWYVWVDELGQLELAEYGYVIDSGTILGDGGLCLTDIAASRTAAGVVNVVSDAEGQISARGWSIKQYGPSEFSTDRREPGGFPWADAILTDRSAATRQLQPFDVLPVSESELASLRDVKGRGVRVKLDTAVPPINQYGQAVGGTLNAEGGGVWRGSVRVYQPATVYDYNPPTPFVGGLPNVTRRASCTGSSYVWLTPTGVHGRQEADDWTLWCQGATLAAGQPEANRRARTLLDTPFSWDGVRRFLSASLRISLVSAPSPVGSAMSIVRLLGEWSADSVDWPGPTVDMVNRVDIAPAAGGWQSFDITPLVWYMVPEALGGYGLPNLGIELRQADEANPATVSFADYGRGDDLGPFLEYVVWEE